MDFQGTDPATGDGKVNAALAALVLALLLAPAAAGEVAAVTDPAPGEALDIVYLANEGFLLRSAGKAVLIDAFVRKPHSFYAALPGPIHDAMISGEPPFERIDLALVSHVHADHFQADVAVEFLQRHPETVLASSRQVLDAVRREVTEPDRLSGRLLEFLPEEGESASLTWDGIVIEFLRLRHGGGEQNRAMQNLGHLIQLGRSKVLHVGDAKMVAANFEAHGLPRSGVDISLVPYWFYLSEEGRAIAATHLAGKVNIAVHIPPGELDEVVGIMADSFPDVEILRDPMETRRLAGGMGEDEPDIGSAGNPMRKGAKVIM